MGKVIKYILDNFSIIIVGILLSAVTAFVTNEINKAREEKIIKETIEKYDRTTRALQDSLQIFYEGEVLKFRDKVPEIALDLLMKSEAYKQLEDREQEYYRELQKVQGLLAAAQVEITSLREFTRTIALPDCTNVTETKITFPRATALSDSVITPTYKFYSTVLLDNPLKWTHKFDFNLQLNQRWVRKESGEIVLDLWSSDNSFKFERSYSYFAPVEEIKPKKFNLGFNVGPGVYYTPRGFDVGLGVQFGLNYNIN